MKSNSLSITIDVEDWYHNPSVCGSPFSVYADVGEFFKKWNQKYDYLTEPTKRVLNLLDEFKVTATFFIVADVVENYPGLVESIVERGHEIGCHGLHHSCKIDPTTKKPLMSYAEFENRTQIAKNLLEKVCGEKVIGYRAPNAYVGGWMLDVLEKIGFKYDSSVCVNSLYNKTDSTLKEISSHPFYPKRGCLEIGEKREIVEFPWAYYDFGIKIPTSGGPMLRFLGKDIILRGLKQSLTRGHTIFYFHPIDLSYEKFPRVGNGRPLLWLIKGRIVEKRVAHILKNLDNINTVCLRDAKNEIN